MMMYDGLDEEEKFWVKDILSTCYVIFNIHEEKAWLYSLIQHPVKTISNFWLIFEKKYKFLF